jgi:AcrR family transcriptional regulator
MRTRNADKESLVKQKAIELLGKDGFEGFSVNNLARACNISVATIYIYYKDKDDLIIQISQEEARKMGESMIRGLHPDMSFESGLRLQWKNRYEYMMANPALGLFFDQLRSSTYQQQFLVTFMSHFEGPIGSFMRNVVKRGELRNMPLEVYWSVAFAPLYSLIRFHNEGKSLGGRPFKMTDELLWQTFDLVLKALKP